MSNEVFEFLSKNGKKGGAVPGPCKRRTRAHYLLMAKLSAEVRRANSARRRLEAA